MCSGAEVHRRRLLDRVRTIDGFPEPTWDDVIARRDEWEEWEEDHLVLDSTGTVDANVGRAIAYVEL